MNSIEYVGSSEVLTFNYQGTDFVRTEDSECGVLWYHDGDQGISGYEINGDLEWDLEEAFIEEMKANKDIYIILDILQSQVGQELLNDVMNLGMSHRQDQLNGTDFMSGNEVLAEFTQDKIKTLKDKLK